MSPCDSVSPIQMKHDTRSDRLELCYSSILYMYTILRVLSYCIFFIQMCCYSWIYQKRLFYKALRSAAV